MVRVNDFLSRVEEIAAEEPGYEHGHWGQDHLCDCIGLIIGAIRRAGGQWRGIHGSNYAARCEVIKLAPVEDPRKLEPGELVFKAYEPGTGGYKLPSRYDPGGEYYNGDLRDYYHVGVVISANPLRIRHMTTPKPKMDTSISKWKYHGWLKKVSKGDIMTQEAIVTGGTLNMRKDASKGSGLIMQIPNGACVEVLDNQGDWCQIKYKGWIGYVMTQYLDLSGKGETISVPKADLEAMYDIIGDWLGLRG